MPNLIRSFRTQMILLLGISMLLAGLITYLNDVIQRFDYIITFVK